MPEGDTVWLTARRLHQGLTGQPLTVFELRVPKLATVDLRGATVNEVAPRGKHLMIRLNNDLTLHCHLRMDGSWYLTRAGEQPRRYPEHLIRARLGTSTWLATGYRVHDLQIVARTDEHQLVGHLGPDLLGDDWSLDTAVSRLLANPAATVGEALLDQRNLAGCGNLYANEVLFLTRVWPWQPVGEVTDLPQLVSTLQRLMLANREHPEQSTTGLLGRGREHWVYQREGEGCRRCHTPIRRMEQGTPPRQRSRYWCPRCQPATD
jgi:endonuclease-8